MTSKPNDDIFNGADGFKPTPNGRKKDRREKRQDSKHQLKDLKDMVNGGEDIFDVIDNIDEE